MRKLKSTSLGLVCTFALIPIACSDDDAGSGTDSGSVVDSGPGGDAQSGEDAGDHHEQEVITTVTLTFAPVAGGTPVVAAFNDPDGDGGQAPTIDAITLSNGTNYDLAVTFSNRLKSPPEDITEEIEDEGDEHQLFFTGSAVQGPATGSNAAAVVSHVYADQDGDGLDLGLENTITTLMTGSGQLTVTLQHLPPVNSTPVKVATLAADVASSGLGALPGDADASVTFDLSVQ